MEKPNYIISIMRADGPDDFTWEVDFESSSYIEIMQRIQELLNRGHEIRLFDPYLGIDLVTEKLR